MGNGAQARLFVVALLVVLVVPLGVASPAALDTHALVVPPSVDPATGAVGARGGYAGSVVVADVAGTLTLTNADLIAHDLVAREPGPEDNPWCVRFAGFDPCPLFASPIVGMAGQATVEGTDQLVPGTTYPFVCSIHHWMQGTLIAI